MKTILTGIAMSFTIISLAQETPASAVTFSGFAEAYYSYDFNEPAGNNRPGFLYSHNRHNEFNINLAFLKGSYNTERVRANLALAAGTYVNANYAAEPGVLKNLYEANLGLKILKDKNLWLDLGIFPSHIGFEGAQSSGCWSLTRSIIAENSPYYESGAKFVYTTDNGKWMLSAMALNGWQRIQRVEGNSLMSWGTQVQFKPSEKLLLNYSTFVGSDKPDSARLWRYFHNLYAIFQMTDKWGLTLGLDLGQEQQVKKSSDMNTWLGGAAILQFKPNSNWAFALRGEYYEDENGVIIATGSPNGFKTLGASFNVDRMIGQNFWWRTEVRTLNSSDEIFIKEDGLKNNNLAVTMSFAITF